LQQRGASLLILAIAGMLLAACGPQLAVAPTVTPGASTPGIQFRMVQVKTATPIGGIVSTEIPTLAPPSPAATAGPGASATVPPALRTVTPDPRAGVARIELQAAKAKLDAGQAILVDVRSAASFAQAHAAGAISLPYGEMATRYGELPRDTLIILYCA